MSEKLNAFLKELKERNLISLYYNRVMFYNEGFGEIQFWDLFEDGDSLVLENKGVMVYFDKWEFSDKYLYIYKGDNVIGSFKLPSEKKIIANHNYFYIDQFGVEMSEALDINTAQKGDWAYCSFETVADGIKGNVDKLKLETDAEEFKKSCVDLANFAAMGYYLVDTWKAK